VTLFLVGVGGALGSIARYVFSTFVQRMTPTLFPVGTFAVNLVGCALFGIIVGLAQERFLLRPGVHARSRVDGGRRTDYAGTG
jgi:fluoride exporter